MKTFVKLPILCATLSLCSLASTAVMAEDNMFEGLKVGINAMYSDKGFTDYDTEVAIVPSAFYDNGTVYARGNHFGYNFIKNAQDEVSVFAQYAGASFDPDNANNAYAGLDERDSSVFVGTSYLRITPFGGLRGQVATDAFGDSDGTYARLTYLGKYKNNNLTLVPSVGVQWQDKNYNDYYYGVTDKESDKTGIDRYSGNDSFHPYVNVMGMYDVNQDWTLFFNQNVAYNPDEIYDSPKVDSRNKFASTLGLMYNF